MTTDAVLYVYYKVEAGAHAELAPRVRRFQAGLATRWPGLEHELMQRPEAANGIETWMETYRHESGIGADMVEAIQRMASLIKLPMPRHGELFVPLR